MALTNNDSNAIRQRSTKHRIAIAEALTLSKDFVSAQDLHFKLKSAGQVVSLSTVYRALATMSELNEVDVILREDGEALYRSCSQDHHHHIVCSSCGTANEITAELVEAWAHDIAAAFGFKNVSHTLEIMGTCSKCSTEQSN